MANDSASGKFKGCTRCWVVAAVLSLGGVALAIGLSGAAGGVPWPASFVALLLAVVVVLALVAALFRQLGLSNPKEAFGLPSGTVRTMLALGVMVLFAVCALTFLAPPGSAGEAGGWLTQGQTVPASAETAALKADVERYEKAGWKVVVTRYGTNDTDPAKYRPAELKLFREPGPTRDQSDMEKQVLTAISALLTTVVGFYFGSRTAEASRDKGVAGTPAAPDTIEAGRKALQDEVVRQDAAIAAANSDLDALSGKKARDPAKANDLVTALADANSLQQQVTDGRKLVTARLADLARQYSAAQSAAPGERSAFDTPLHAALAAAQDAIKALGPLVKGWQDAIQVAQKLT